MMNSLILFCRLFLFCHTFLKEKMIRSILFLSFFANVDSNLKIIHVTLCKFECAITAGNNEMITIDLIGHCFIVYCQRSRFELDTKKLKIIFIRYSLTAIVISVELE